MLDSYWIAWLVHLEGVSSVLLGSKRLFGNHRWSSVVSNVHHLQQLSSNYDVLFMEEAGVAFYHISFKTSPALIHLLTFYRRTNLISWIRFSWRVYSPYRIPCLTFSVCLSQNIDVLPIRLAATAATTRHCSFPDPHIGSEIGPLNSFYKLKSSTFRRKSHYAALVLVACPHSGLWCSWFLSTIASVFLKDLVETLFFLH